jgi:hypothetical protein
MKYQIQTFFFYIILLSAISSNAQQVSTEKIKTQIETYKNDIRGPYKNIQVL